jgi:regulatory protein
MPTQRSPRRSPAAGPPPTEASLHDAALAHLGRFAATEVGLRRVLERRIARWAHRAEGEGLAVSEIAAWLAEAKRAAAVVARRLTAAGAVDDAAFAAARARRLLRAGRSRRAVAAHLAGKGVTAEVAQAALPADAEASELDAALHWCRRRRVGPFATGPAAGKAGDAAARLKALASLARAGFPRRVAEAALDMAPSAAADRLTKGTAA